MGSPFNRQLSVWADFNSVDEHRRIRASLRFAETAERPVRGEWIRLYDDEGNAVFGVVEAIDGMILRVRPEMATWTYEVSVKSPFVGQAAFKPELQADQKA